MKIRSIFISGMAAFCLLLMNVSAVCQEIVKDVDVTTEEAKVRMNTETPSSYFVEIGGPDNYYFKTQVDYTNEISLSNINAEGEKFQDGLYSLQITPVFELTPEQREALSKYREVNDQEAIAAFRAKHNLPAEVEQVAMNFRIQNGQFVLPTQQEGELNLPTMSSQWELNHPSLYASVNTVGLDYPDHAMDNTTMAGVAQVFVTDVVIQGSLCVGFDCVNGENFGSDTHRLKENNLRIHFQDTSNSGSFPTRDWRIVINDSINGGANYFAVEDSDGGTYPFRILAGAGNNALYVDAQGDVGLNTSNPVVELHVADGDSPTLRLEQNGSAGFGPQTWDVAGNETNFFVRDVTNGSELPFKIRPGADDNSLVINGNNSVQIGGINSTLDANLILSGKKSIRLPLGTTAERPTASEGMLRGNSDNNTVEYYNGSSWLDLDPTSGGSTFEVTNTGGPALFKVNRIDGKIGGLVAGTTGSAFIFDNSGDFTIYPDTRANIEAGTGFTGSSILTVKGSTNRVGINCTNPSTELHVNGTISTTAATVSTSVACSSDRRFKQNITPLQSSLEKVLNLQGVNYDWRIDEFPDKHFNEGQQIGFIAQEIEEVLPIVVKTDQEGYKSVDYSRLTPVLVEAVKEQQKIIDAQQAEINELQSQLASLEELKAQVAQLTQVVMQQAEQANEKANAGDE